jgi:hypothetical protein
VLSSLHRPWPPPRHRQPMLPIRTLRTSTSS